MPWRWREQREGEAGMKHEWKEGETVERESVCACVCMCVYMVINMGGGLWRETTINYTFTHHITGQLKLEQSCVNRAKTNRLNSLQQRERERPGDPCSDKQINYSALNYHHQLYEATTP